MLNLTRLSNRKFRHGPQREGWEWKEESGGAMYSYYQKPCRPESPRETVVKGIQEGFQDFYKNQYSPMANRGVVSKMF